MYRSHWGDTIRRRGRFLVVGSLVAALIASACGGDDGNDASSASRDGDTSGSVDGSTPGASGTSASGGDDTECTKDRVGGEMVVFMNAPNGGLDPAILQGSGSNGGDLAGAFYDTVIRYDATTDTYEPRLAESWDSNDDGSVWTLRLRDDVTFGNGDPFTTEHIAAHIERMKDAPVRTSGSAKLVTDIEIVDEYEMVVTLDGPFNFPFLMSSELGWVPNNNLVEERGDNFHLNPTGGGAGAFEVRSVSQAEGESIVLTAKDDYWGGPVCVQRLEFQYVPGTDARLEAFLNGEADSMFVFTNMQAAELRERELLDYEVANGVPIYVGADQGITGGGETPFNDVRVREAMQLAINYEILHQRLFEGLDPAPTSAIVPEDSPLYSGVEGPPYDPERAKQLVQETIDDGVWDGSFTFTHDSTPESTDRAVLLQGMWEAVGMDVTLEGVPSAASRMIVEKQFEVSHLGHSVMPPGPWTTLNALRSDSPRRRLGFSDPDMDAAIDQLREAITLEENREAIAEIQRVWNRTFPEIVTEHAVWGIASQPYVHGLTFGPETTPYYEDAWIEQ